MTQAETPSTALAARFPRAVTPLLAVLFLGLGLGGCVPAAGPTVVPEPLPSAAETLTLPLDPKVLHGTLDNGLSYYVRANARPEDRAEIQLVVNAGSLLEDEDQRGLAHFVEHMAFNGTENFEKQELVDYLQSLGMQFGSDLNASTSFEETVYTLTVPTDDEETLDRAFLILQDWAHGIRFDPEEVERERGVVVEEWRLGRGAGARLRDQQFPVLFAGSRYAERLPIGLLEVLQEAPPEALVRFYREWYRPELMAVIAVGDFDATAVEAKIRERFAQAWGPEDGRPRGSFPVPAQEGTRVSIATDPELTSSSITVYYKHPPRETGTEEAYRRSLVEALYHAMFNARLQELARQADPPFVYGYSGSGDLVRTKDAFTLGAGVRQGDVLGALRALLTATEQVEQHGFTEGELARAKAQVERAYQQAFEERDKAYSATFAGEYASHFLEGVPAPGIEAELALMERYLPTINLEELHHLADTWIRDDDRVILVTAPESDRESGTLPAAEAVEGVFAEVTGSPVEPYEDRVRDEPLLPVPPTPGPVVAEDAIPEIGVTLWKLANGVRVVLKPTDFQNDEVLLTGWSSGGTSLVPEDDHVSAAFADTLVSESGAGEFDVVELRKALAGKIAFAGAGLSELQESLSAGGSPRDLETAFQLLYLRATAPRLDEEAVTAFMQKTESLIENRLASPAAVFQDRFGEIVSQGHPRRRPLSPELLAEIDPQKAFEIYRQRFARAGDFTFVLVGNFDLETVRPLVETYLGGLPGGEGERFRDIGLERPRDVVRFEVARGLEPKAFVRLAFFGDAEWSRINNLRLSTLTRMLRERLREVLREDKGGTYGVSVGGSISKWPRERFTTNLVFGCAPENVSELVEAAFSEIRAYKAGEIDPQTLEDAKETSRRARQVNLEENGFWLRSLAAAYTYGLDPRDVLTFEDRLDALTLEDIAAAAREFFPEDRYVQGVLLPEEAGGQAPPPASSTEQE